MSAPVKIVYFDCQSGISGDMTLAALIDAGASFEAIQSGIESMEVRVELAIQPTRRRGLRGLQLIVDHEPEHSHRRLRDILTLIRRGHLSPRAKHIAMRLFERLAAVEAKVHGTSIDQVTFHEVGAVDSIVDMVGVAIAWDELCIEGGFASSVPMGTGFVKTAHGMLSIPAPATCELLRGVPTAQCDLPWEMTTPTGAVILAELVQTFGPMPSMRIDKIGYGAGQREIPDRPNLLRVMVGHSEDTPLESTDCTDKVTDQVMVLETNLDDISGEQIGFAIETLWGLGALDVFAIPIQMKKNRPGTLLSVLCRIEQKGEIERAIFEHTGTLGIRGRLQSRTLAPRMNVQVMTPWGVVSGKVSKRPSGEMDFSPEYEDCRTIAREHGLRLIEVIERVTASYSPEGLERSENEDV